MSVRDNLLKWNLSPKREESVNIERKKTFQWHWKKILLFVFFHYPIFKENKELESFYYNKD